VSDGIGHLGTTASSMWRAYLSLTEGPFAEAFDQRLEPRRIQRNTEETEKIQSASGSEKPRPLADRERQREKLIGQLLEPADYLNVAFVRAR